MTGVAVEALLRRENALVIAALAALILLAWGALLLGAGTGMDPFAMSGWLMPLELPPALSAEGS